MITSYMTDEEICNETRSDFLEMKEKIRIAFREFYRAQNQTDGKRYFIHSIVQEKTYRTKRHNTWYIRFYDRGHTPTNQMLANCIIYTTILHKDGRTDYLFLTNLDKFITFKLTAHFIQRY